MMRPVSLAFVVLTALGSACALSPLSKKGGDAGSGGMDAEAGAPGSGGSGGSTGGTSSRAGRGGTSASGGSGNSGTGATGGTNQGGTGNSSSGRGGSNSGGSVNGEAGDPGVGGTGGSSSAGTDAGGSTSAAGTGSGGSGGEPGGVRIVGRTMPGTMMGDRFAWSGTSFTARFTGTQITMRMSDSSKNEFAIVVDGSVTRVGTNSGVTRYPLASGLAEGEHTVTVWRRTDSQNGASEFIGFTELSPGGAILAPPPRLGRRIEIIGDSITGGWGNEGTKPCAAHTPPNHNNYMAYGSVASRLLNAELVTLAWYDIGMYRNRGEVEASPDAMPARYEKIIPADDTAPEWDFTSYVAQAVVINLGTNDFDQGDPGQPFIEAYRDFLLTVRLKYRDAYIFSLIQAPELAASIDAAVDARVRSGDERVESFDIGVTQGTNNGCEDHPDLARHQAMGEKLAGRMRSVLAWN